MAEQLNEIIEVIASFKKSEVTPKYFKWRDKVYQINKVHLIHLSRSGKELWYHFSVSDNANYFQLTFNPFNLSWKLTNHYEA